MTVTTSSTNTIGLHMKVNSAASVVRPGCDSMVLTQRLMPPGNSSAISRYSARKLKAMVQAQPSPGAKASGRPYIRQLCTQLCSHCMSPMCPKIATFCTLPSTTAAGSRIRSPPTATTSPCTTACGPSSTLPSTATTESPTVLST